MDTKIANRTVRPPTALLRACARVLPWLVVRGMLPVCLLLAVTPVHGADPKPVPSRIRKTDIMIWDEQYLRGPPKGWKVPSDYQTAYGARNSEITKAVRFGRFGLLSGRRLYTTWRPIVPLTDEIYAEGTTTIFDTHVSDLVTPPFELKLDYVTFLLSGGYRPGEACVNLLIDGKVVRSATGRNDDTLEFVAFDVKAFRGKKAQIQVLDTSTAALAYITVDCVCQSPDPKGSVRIIAGPPSTTNTAPARAQMLTGRLDGAARIADGRLLVGGKAVDLADLLLLETGVRCAGDFSGKRVELINGDVLSADVLGFDKETLTIRHALFGKIEVAVSNVAQALFIPGPTIEAAPGVLVHSGGSKIPGELLWIRDDNIAITCKLGVVPLPRGRVRAYVFARVAPPAKARDTVVLADGSTLSGTLTLSGQNVVLTHDVLGPMKLAVTDVARVTRSLPGVTGLTSLRGEIRERVGPIPPPVPLVVNSTSGATLRMFPRTVVRYTLPKAARSRRFRAALFPIANSRTPLTARIRAGSNSKTYTIPADSAGVDVDIDLGQSGVIELTADAPDAISYPCGIEWRNAFIVERPQ